MNKLSREVLGSQASLQQVSRQSVDYIIMYTISKMNQSSYYQQN